MFAELFPPNQQIDVAGKRYVNLDNAATTPPFSEVEEAVQQFMNEYGSVHRGAGHKSQRSTDLYEESRQVILDFVGAPPDAYVVFTGNTTGAMNAAAHYFSFLGGKVAVSAIEHSSSWLPWIKAEGVKALGREQVSLGEMDSVAEQIQKLGREQVLQYDVDSKFEFDLEGIENLLQENNVKLLVVTASSNATGYRPPLKEIGHLAHKYGALYLVDGCQYIQHHPINMVEQSIDFLAASGHKFYSPYGGGFLVAPKSFMDRMLPYEIGGGNLPYITGEGEFLRYRNQMAHDPGTPNAVGAVAMAAALRVLKRIGLETVEAYEEGLTRQAYERMSQNPRIRLLVSRKHLSTVIPFNIVGKDAREVARSLNDDFGIGVRAGSFCVYHVVRKLLQIEDETEIVRGVKEGDEGAVPGFVRASFALCNDERDVERLIEALEEITRG